MAKDSLVTLQPTLKASRRLHAFPSTGDFGSSVADHTMLQKLKESFLDWSSYENLPAELNDSRSSSSQPSLHFSCEPTEIS